MTTEPSAARPGLEELLGSYLNAPCVPAPPELPAGAGKRERFEHVLGRAGVDYKVDEDGDITFTRHGEDWLLLVDESDPTYFRLTIPGVWPARNEAERAAAREEVNHSNITYKVAKAVVLEKTIWVSIEAFFEPLEDFEPALERLLDIGSDVAADLRARMRAATAAGNGAEEC